MIFCFPIALILNLWVRKELRLTILFFLMLPSWTNFIVRIYSWFFLLKNDGLLFKTLSFFNLINENSSLLANFPTTILVMVYCYFPFILIPLNSAIGNIDKRTLESAADLGSTALQTFFYVILPMSLRGIFFGFVIVVLSAFGDFVVPDFIGGGLNVYWGNLVLYKFVYLADFHIGGAIIFLGLLCLLLSILIFYFILRVLFFTVGKKIGLSEKLLYLKFD